MCVLVVSVCLLISHWTQCLDQLQWIIIHFFLQAAMLIVPKYCSLPNASFFFFSLEILHTAWLNEAHGCMENVILMQVQNNSELFGFAAIGSVLHNWTNKSHVHSKPQGKILAIRATSLHCNPAFRSKSVIAFFLFRGNCMGLHLHLHL